MRGRVGLLVMAVAALVAQPAGAALEGGTAGSDVATAVVATGRLTSIEDRFFQTFSSTGGEWRLSTPAGVATNGGIVVAGPDAAALAVLPSFASHVTALLPMQAGRPAGRGIAAAALAAGPSSLALDASGQAVAALRGGQIVRGRLGAWRAVADRRSLARSAPGCDLASAEAVAEAGDGRLVVGGRCRRAGWSGLILQGAGGRWGGVRARGFAAGSVLMLRSEAHGAAALVASGGRDRRIAAASLGRSVRWSRPLRMRAGERVCSTAGGTLATGRTAFVVALCDGGAGRVAVLTAGPSRSRPAILAAGRAKGATAVGLGPAAGAAGDRIVRSGPLASLGISVESFAVEGRRVRPLRLSADGRRWLADGAEVVLSLPYGSSS